MRDQHRLATLRILGFCVSGSFSLFLREQSYSAVAAEFPLFV